MSQGERTKEQKAKDNQMGCLVILGVIAVLFVVGIAWTAIFGESESSTSSSPTETAPMITMRGEIMVYDQATCAGGPMVKVSAGARGPEPKEFAAGNAPCVLNFSMKVPEGATTYKVQVDNHPERVFRPADMTKTGPTGIEYYEIDMTVGGN